MKLPDGSKIMRVTRTKKGGTKMSILIPDDMLRRIGCTPGDLIIITCDAEDEGKLIVKRVRQENLPKMVAPGRLST